MWQVMRAAVARALEAADRAQRRWPPLAFPVAVWRKFGDDQAGSLAALIAYYAFVATFPLLLALVTVLDIVVRRDPALRRRVLGSALRAYPVIGPQIGSSVHPLRATGLALAAQNAMNTVWAIPPERRPAFPWSLLRGIGLVLVVGIGQIVTTPLSSLAGGLGHVVTGAWLQAETIACALALNAGVFWLALRLATAAEVGWGDLRLAAALAAVSWQVLQLLGGYIVGRTLAHSSALYGVFGVVLGLLAWLYLQAQVTLYAVEACVVRARRLWPRHLTGGSGMMAS